MALQDEKTIIRSTLDPEIVIDLLQIEDIFEGTSDKVSIGKENERVGPQLQNWLGTDFPFVCINNYIFDSNEIVNLKLNATGFLPTITFIFQLTRSDAFSVSSFPKDGDLLSIFIKAKDNAFKPIRNDYLITNVIGGGGGRENFNSTVIIVGELFIPHLRDEIITSYTGNSFDVLQTIAKQLKLGFATNETSTKDSQAWICGGLTWGDYIQDVALHSYKDDDSFYKCFIDVYYHLNFININNQLEGDPKRASAVFDNVLKTELFAGDKDTINQSQITGPKVLSNIDNFQNTNMWIRTYSTINNSSEINKELGYKYNMQFFCMKSLKYWEIFIDPKTTEGAERKKMILKGRTFPKKEDEPDREGKTESLWTYWKDQQKYVWKGIQSRNVHNRYIYAEANNMRNLAELSKLYLEVEVTRWNPNIYMGEKIPILLIAMRDQTKVSATAAGDDYEASRSTSRQVPVVDQFYSGYYVVNGMEIIYQQDGSDKSTALPRDGEEVNPHNFVPTFYQKIVLTRREWPTPVG